MPGLLASLLAVLAAADAGALGAWNANGARLELKEEDGKVVGRLAAEGGPCPLPAGTEVLTGTLLDDSLSAQVRLCLVAPRCGTSPQTALAVLLVTRTLTGGVHTRAPCAQDVRSLVLRRPGDAMAMTPPGPSERLSRTPSPRTVRAPAAPPQKIAAEAKLETAAIGAIAARPVGAAHGYDPRDARRAGTPQSEAERLVGEAAAQLEKGAFERARKLFHEALQKDPERAAAYNGMGVTFYARGDLDEALAWYKRSLEADPGFGDAFYNLACAYALQGHREIAFRYLRLAALNQYSGRELMEQDPDLASLRGDAQWREILAQMKP